MIQFRILMFFILLSNICLADAQLLLFTETKASELGRPIRVELYAVSIKEKLSEINLTPLNKNFGVVTEYSTADTHDSRWPKQTTQSLNLKLYPRQAGNIVIPELSLGKFKSKDKTIKVSNGETGKPHLIISANEPYERQQFTVHVTLAAKQLSSRLSIAEDEKIKGFKNSSLNFKRIKQKNGTYLLQIGWALSALQYGHQKLELPAIDYSVSGVSRKKYYLPAHQINVKKLPAYLPPTVPVGKVSLHSQLSTTGLINTDSILYWHLQLKGKFNNSYQLPAVLRQIKSNNQIKFFPVNSKRSQQVNEDNNTSSVTHDIPFKILTSGLNKLPEIEIQFFEPNSGKLFNFVQQSRSVLALNFFWRILLSGILFVVLIYLLRFLYLRWKRFHYTKQQRNLAIQLLQNNPDVHAIRESLRLLAKAEYWPANISLSQWAEYWSKKYKTELTFPHLITRLLHACYSQTNNDNNNINEINAIANEFTATINSRKKTKILPC